MSLASWLSCCCCCCCWWWWWWWWCCCFLQTTGVGRTGGCPSIWRCAGNGTQKQITQYTILLQQMQKSPSTISFEPKTSSNFLRLPMSSGVGQLYPAENVWRTCVKRLFCLMCPKSPDAGSPMLGHFHTECQSLAKLHFSNGVTSVEGDLVVQSHHFKL